MFLVMGTSVFAQNITTASAYFKSVSEYYGTLKDYEVDFEIKMDNKKLPVFYLLKLLIY